jgi:hypothetical protein
MSDFVVSTAVEELIKFFGIRPNVEAGPLMALNRDGRTQDVVVAIANTMGLPVRFNISLVSGRNTFRSEAVVPTDHTGKGTEGIEAQVITPVDLPLYGSDALRNYPISLLLRPEFLSLPSATAITLLAHELSHVLLHSLRHPYEQSEQFTDLVPLVFGFADIVRRGRVISNTTENIDGCRATVTTTYGYLSDPQFSFALTTVQSRLREWNQRKDDLSASSAELKRRVTEANQTLTHLLKLRSEVALNLRKVRKQDGPRIVLMHSADFTDELERTMRDAQELVKQTDCFNEPVLTPKGLQRIGECQQKAAVLSRRLSGQLAQLKIDVELLARNRGYVHRVIPCLRDAYYAIRAITADEKNTAIETEKAAESVQPSTETTSGADQVNDAITIHCWQCKAKIIVTTTMRGKYTKCRSCGTRQTCPT